MMKFCLPFVVYLHLTYPFALYARDLESSVEGASTQALDKEPLHQLLRSLTQDPASYFYHLLPEITDMIADQALAHWTFLHNQRRWTDAALEAARQDREPEHLLEVATVEEEFLVQLLREREAELTTVEEWKKHAVVTLLTFSGIKGACADVTVFMTRNETRCAAKRAALVLANCSAQSTIADTMTALACDVTKNSAWYIALRAARTTFVDTAGGVLASNPRSVVIDEQFGKAIYRVTETLSWLTFLDPSKQIWQKVYAAVHAHPLSDVEVNWFASPDHFYERLNMHLVARVASPRAQALLQPLMQHLQRMGNKIFAQESGPQGQTLE